MPVGPKCSWGGHPWPVPDYAIPTLSLLKGRSRVSGLTMYEAPDQHQKLNTSASLLPLPLLCFYLHKSCRRHKSSLQQAEWNPCVVGRRPWMAGERRRARTALRRGPRGSRGGMREPGAQRRAGCRDRPMPTFAPTKAGRRKGETSQWCHHIKRICSQQFGPPSTKRRRYVPPTCPAISNHQLRKNASKSALMVSAWVVGMPWG